MKKQMTKQAAAIMIATLVLSSGAVYAETTNQTNDQANHQTSKLAMRIPAETEPTLAMNIPAETESTLAVSSTDVATDSYSVIINDDAIGTVAYVKDEHMMIPLREAAEALGFEVIWHQKEQRAELTLPGYPIWTMVEPDVDRYAYNKMNVSLGAAPVNLKSKLFVPDSFFSEILRSSVTYEGNQVHISLKVEEANMHTQQGVVTVINRDEQYPSIQMNGTGTEGAILNIDDATIIRNYAGEQVSLEELTLGIHIEVKHSMAMTMSLPPQTYAFEISVLEEASDVDLLGTSGNIVELRTDEDGKVSIVVDGMAMSESSPEKIVLHLHDETIIVDTEGNSIAREQLTEGANVLTYYGPRLAKSLPPIGQAWKIVYLGSE